MALAPLDVAIAVFLALHGVVHAWYVAISRGWVEYEDAMGWTGTSWVLSRFLDAGPVLAVGSVLYVLVAVGFVAGAVAYLLGAGSWPVLLAAAAVLSAATILLMWDGRVEQPVEKGAVGILIDLGVLAWVLGPL